MKSRLFSSTSILMMIVALFVTFCATDVYAQKFVKHKNGKHYDVRVWWEVRYPDGSVGFSVNDKKNIVVDDGRGYSSVEYLYMHGRFKVSKGGYQGIVDAQGREIIPPVKYSSVKDKYEYSYPNIYKYYEVGVGGSSYSPDKVGLCNYEGREVLPCEFKSIGIDKEGTSDKNFFYHSVKKDKDGVSRVALCDTTGRFFFPFSEYGRVMVVMEKVSHSADFTEDIIGLEVLKDGKWGVCDKNGNEIIPAIYEYVSIETNLGELQAMVEENGKYGIVDANGNVIIPPVFEDYIHNINGGFSTKINGEYVDIDPAQFTNPAQKIVMKDGLWVLSYGDKTFSIRGYDALKWDEARGVYIGFLKGYVTDIERLGKEKNSIAKQAFDEAYAIPDNEVEDKIAAYNLVMEIDGKNKEGYKAASINNIGALYKELGYEDTALQYYDKAAAMGNTTARDNAAAIRDARRAEERAERMQRVNNALNQISNSLSGISTTIQQYNNSGYSNYNSYDNTSTGSSGSGGGTVRRAANCTKCAGSGECRKCGGDGYVLGKISQEFEPCSSCNFRDGAPKSKRGKCTFCNGTGKQ